MVTGLLGQLQQQERDEREIAEGEESVDEGELDSESDEYDTSVEELESDGGSTNLTQTGHATATSVYM